MFYWVFFSLFFLNANIVLKHIHSLISGQTFRYVNNFVSIKWNTHTIKIEVVKNAKSLFFVVRVVVVLACSLCVYILQPIRIDIRIKSVKYLLDSILSWWEELSVVSRIHTTDSFEWFRELVRSDISNRNADFTGFEPFTRGNWKIYYIINKEEKSGRHVPIEEEKKTKEKFTYP